LIQLAGRTGKESVEHPRASRDDLANSVTGCLQLLSKVEQKIPMVGAAVWSPSQGWSDEAARPRSAHEAWARQYYRGTTDRFAAIGGMTSPIPPGRR
jgi:hypothetical protein